MKKIHKYLILVSIMMLMLTGCKKSMSYTYKVETGDEVKITLNTTDGYKFDSNLPFTISKDGTELSQGTFIQGSYYEEYVSVANEQGTILDEGSNDNIEYVFYSYEDAEYNYIIKIKDSNTAMLIGNPNSREEAEKCFGLLSIELKK
ncbi:MAG: hypothetical protein PUC65_09335 [Clostridiales bacterium]|nr:hypothetical protein [Clostridiales bacterium]